MAAVVVCLIPVAALATSEAKIVEPKLECSMQMGAVRECRVDGYVILETTKAGWFRYECSIDVIQTHRVIEGGTIEKIITASRIAIFDVPEREGMNRHELLNDVPFLYAARFFPLRPVQGGPGWIDSRLGEKKCVLMSYQPH